MTVTPDESRSFRGPWSHPGDAGSMCFSADRTRLFVADPRGVHVYRTADGVEESLFAGGASPAANRFTLLAPWADRALARDDGGLEVWELSSGKLLARHPLVTATLEDVSQDGALALVTVAAESGNPMRVDRKLISLETGAVLATLDREIESFFARASAAFVQGGILQGSRNRRLVLLDAEAHVLRELQPAADPAAEGFVALDSVRAMAGGSMALVQYQGSLELRDVATGAITHSRIAGHFLSSIAITDDRSAFVARPGDSQISDAPYEVYDAKTLERWARPRFLPTPIEDSYAIAIAPDGSIAGVTPEGQIICSLSADSRRRRRSTHVLRSSVSSIAVSPDGKSLLIGCRSGSVSVLSGTGELKALPSLSNSSIEGCGFADGGRVAWAAADSGVRIWRTEPWAFETDVIGPFSAYPSVASPRKRWILHAADLAILVIDPARPREPRTLALQPPPGMRDGRLDTAAISDDGAWVAGVARDRVVVWDVSTGRSVATLPAAEVFRAEGNMQLAFLPEERRLLVTALTEGVVLWDPTTGARRELGRWPEVTFALPDPTGERILVQARWPDDTELKLRVHRMADGAHVATLAGIEVEGGLATPVAWAGPHRVHVATYDRRLVSWPVP